MGAPIWQCVCVCMSTWVLNSAPPIHSYMETWVPLSGTVCMLQSCHFWSYTLVSMCICISTCIYGLCVCSNQPISSPTSSLACVHASVHVLISTYSPCQLNPLCIVTWKHGYLCMGCSHAISGPTPWLECVYASIHVFMACVFVPINPFLLPLLH